MQTGVISFCDRICFNIKSLNVKDDILDYIENKYKIRILEKHWHHLDEKNDFILFLDLTVASVWGIVDLTINKYTLILNLITALLYLKVYHPYWHIISVVKSIVVIFYFLENK